MRRPSRLPVLLAALLCAVPLLVGQSQEGDDPPDRGGEDDAASDPTRTAKSSLSIGALKHGGVLAQEEKLRAAPFLVARRDGRVTLGFLDYASGRGDTIALLTAPPEQLAPARPTLQHVGDGRGALLRPVGVADATDRLHLFWTAVDLEAGGAAQLWSATQIDELGFGPPRALTGGPLVRMNCDAVLAPDGRIWLAWESEAPGVDGGKPQRDVVAAPLLDDGTLGAPLVVGDGPASDLDVRVVASGEKLWFAWASYTGRDYEVKLRSLEPRSGALGAVIDVSANSAADDLHPALAAAPDGSLWVAWDAAIHPLRGDSTPPQLRLQRRKIEIDVAVRCARVVDGVVTLPPARTAGIEPGVVEGALGLSLAGGLPTLAIGGDGRPWLAYRQLVTRANQRTHGWSLLLQPLGPQGFEAPVEVEQSLSTLAEPALVAAGGQVVAAFTTDRRIDRGASRAGPPKVFAEPLRKLGVTFDVWRGPFGIGVARPAAPAEPFALPPCVARREQQDVPHFHPSGAALDDPLIAGTRHFEVTRGEERYLAYWGDLHRHSCISRCSAGFEPTPSDRFASGRDVHLCDFMALTDHSGQINPPAWWQLDKLTALYHSPGFVTLAGYEWSTRQWGHHNVILPGRMTPFIGEISDLDALFSKLPKGGAVTIPHHPSDTSFANDFAECDDRFTRLIEIYQARRGNFEFDGCFKQAPNAGALGSFVQDAFQQGHQYGIIASSDHAEGQAYAVVLASELSRAALFAALRERRTYGATTKGMFVDLRIDGALMGEALELATPPRVRLVARGAAELAEVVVYRNGKAWQRVAAEPDGEWNRQAPLRLQVRIAPGGPPSAAPCELSFALQASRFEGVLEKRPQARKKAPPSWKAAGPAATLQVPEGFAAVQGLRDFPIHLAGDLDDTLTMELPGGTQTVALRALRDAPISGELPGGAAFTVSLELGDGALTLARGLGTRDFVQEWDDAELRSGKSWYYARFIQVDGEICWSSPIFVSRP